MRTLPGTVERTLGRIATFSSTRWGKLVVVAAWLVAVAAVSSPAAKFEDAQKNEATSFLPGDAESTQVLVIIGLLLRAVVAPLLLVGTVIVSFLASLGAGVVIFRYVFDFPGEDPSLPLFGFIFLVALGVDYNIFLMARVREESVRHGSHEGMIRGLAVTGAVITSAGIVLAGTFSVLAVLPLVTLTEIGFLVAFGVLLDTFIVRSVLLPATVIELDRRIWWPSRLSRGDP